MLIFNLGAPHHLGKHPDPADNPLFGHWVEGLQTTPNYHTPTDGTHVLGVLFEPVGFHALFGHAMPALVDRVVSAADVLPHTTLAEVTALLPHGEDRKAHEAILDCLCRHAAPLPPWLWHIYEHIVNTDGNVSLDEAYRAAGRPVRTVTARFKRAVGVSPKALSRIRRLLALLEAVDPAQDVNWTTLAHQHGFYDQPHFNREFRKLSGLFPSEYLVHRRREYADLTKGEHVVFAPVA